MTDGLVAALARAQLAFPAIVKSHSNPAFKGSQYADVADVLAAVRPVLAAEGIVVMQRTVLEDDGTVLLITQLMLGDEVEQSFFPLPVHHLTAQQVGSLMTYHRRYQLCAILGVHPVGDDDDGNLAATAPAPQAVARPAAVTGDPYALAAANPPEKPLAAMTAGEMARYGESIGIRVSGNKSEIMRQLEPYLRAATGEEPFELLPQSPTDRGDVSGAGITTTDERPEFSPTVAGAGSIRRSTNSAMKADES